MIFLVEGPDGVGKTTLARALSRRIKAPHVAYGPLPVWWTKRDYLDRLVFHAVYDRYHWSAAAYATVHPQPWPACAVDCVEIDNAIDRRVHGAYFRVLLYASDDRYFDSLPQDEMFNREQVNRVNYEFKKFKENLGFDLCHDVCESWLTVDEVMAYVRQV